MNKKYIFLLAFLLIISKAFPQGKIQGKIIDSINSTVIQYAVVSIYPANGSAPLSGKLTDTTGIFTLDNITAATYDLKVEFIGYHAKQLKGITIGPNQTLNIGEIKLLPSSTLNEVVVDAEQNAVSSKIDKQVYKADQFLSAKGGTGIDVIKNMPSVTVNAEGEIRLRGNTGFLILLNGKPVLTDATTVLSQIPANSIENIEIITAPSAKYDADGKTGIINITTKKGSDDGFLYTINGQYGLPAVNSYDNLNEPKRFGGDATFNYKKNKWDVSAGASYQENDLAGRRVGDVNPSIGSLYTSFPSIGERIFQRRNYAIRASATYKLNATNSFSLSSYTGQRRQYRRADIY